MRCWHAWIQVNASPDKKASFLEVPAPCMQVPVPVETSRLLEGSQCCQVRQEPETPRERGERGERGTAL